MYVSVVYHDFESIHGIIFWFMVDNGYRNQENMQRKTTLSRVALIRADIRYCGIYPEESISNCRLIIRSCRTDDKKGKPFEGKQFVDSTR